MRPRHHHGLLLAVVLSVLACKSSTESRDHGAKASEGTERATIAVLVDGAERPPLSLSVAGARRTLRESVSAHAPPHDQWEQVVAEGNGRRLEIAIDDYRGYDLMLYQDAKGRPSLGLFRKPSRPHPGQHTPLQAVVALERIEIRTASARQAPTAEAALSVTHRGATKMIALPELATLGTTPWRIGGKRQKASSWRLLDVLALAGPLESPTSVTLRAGAGATLALQLASDDGETVLIKVSGRRFHLKGVDAEGKTVWRFKDATAVSIE